jgi:hypothetical protein
MLGFFNDCHFIIDNEIPITISLLMTKSVEKNVIQCYVAEQLRGAWFINGIKEPLHKVYYKKSITMKKNMYELLKKYRGKKETEIQKNAYKKDVYNCQYPSIQAVIRTLAQNNSVSICDSNSDIWNACVENFKKKYQELFE